MEEQPGECGQTDETGQETNKEEEYTCLPSCSFDTNSCIQYILSFSTIICYISEWIIRSEIEKTLLRLNFLKDLIGGPLVESEIKQPETDEKQANFKCDGCLSVQTGGNTVNIDKTGVQDVQKTGIESGFAYETDCTHEITGSYTGMDIAIPCPFYQNSTNTVDIQVCPYYPATKTYHKRFGGYYTGYANRAPYDIICKPPVFGKSSMSENRRPRKCYERKRATGYFTMSGFGVPDVFKKI